MLALMLTCAAVFAFASGGEEGLPEAGEGAEYDGSYTNLKGETTYFKGQLGFEAAIDDAVASATSSTQNTVCEIKLFNDVEYYKSFTFPRYINLKIDLNGHTLTRIDLYGTKMTYDPATETYVESTTTAARNAFVVPRDVKFTMTSSTPGAVFKTASVQGTA